MPTSRIGSLFKWFYLQVLEPVQRVSTATRHLVTPPNWPTLLTKESTHTIHTQTTSSLMFKSDLGDWAKEKQLRKILNISQRDFPGMNEKSKASSVLTLISSVGGFMCYCDGFIFTSQLVNRCRAHPQHPGSSVQIVTFRFAPLRS